MPAYYILGTQALSTGSQVFVNGSGRMALHKCSSRALVTGMEAIDTRIGQAMCIRWY